MRADQACKRRGGGPRTPPPTCARPSYTGGCTQHEREDAHYERGRKDGLGQALELVDTFLRSDGEQGRRRPAEEIVAAVESGGPSG